jgi:hypothetical protein
MLLLLCKDANAAAPVLEGNWWCGQCVAAVPLPPAVCGGDGL